MLFHLFLFILHLLSGVCKTRNSPEHPRNTKNFLTQIVKNIKLINPLTPVPPVTARAKTIPEMPVPPIVARKKHMVTNAHSLAPWRLFGSPIVLSIIRANKPIRICFLRIFLENSRGPREKVFRLDSYVQNVEEDYGASPLLFTNFQGLVFHLEHRKFPLWG